MILISLAFLISNILFSCSLSRYAFAYYTSTSSYQNLRPKTHTLTSLSPTQPKPARDTHALPPDNICTAYWKYNKIKPLDLDADPDVVDFARGLSAQQSKKIKPAKVISASTIRKAGLDFKRYGRQIDGEKQFENEVENEEKGAMETEVEECVVYEHDDFPGMFSFATFTLLFPVTESTFGVIWKKCGDSNDACI